MPLFFHEGEMHLFCHVPKCAGAAVERLLADAFGPLAFLDEGHYSRPARLRWTRTSPQHISAEDLLRLVPEGRIASSFAVVRHPLPRLLSAYRHAVARDAVPAHMRPERWAADYLRLRRTRPFAFDHHLRPQADFLLPETRVFRLEEGLGPVVAWLNERFGARIDAAAVPNVTHEDPARPARPTRDEPVSPRLRRLAEEIYAGDYRRFGYSGDGGAHRYPLPVHPTPNPFSGSRLRLAAYRGAMAVRGLDARLTGRLSGLRMAAGSEEW